MKYQIYYAIGDRGSVAIVTANSVIEAINSFLQNNPNAKIISTESL